MTLRKRVTIAELERDGAVLQIQDGNHGEKHPVAADYLATGIPFLMASDISDGTVDLRGCKFIAKRQADSLRIGFARSGDVLLTHKGTVGNVAVLPHVEDYAMLTPQVTYYRLDNSKLLNRYLLYAFAAPDFQDRLRSVSAQSTRPYIGVTAQRNLEITWVECAIQRRIASILSAYDDLIENNTRRIKILEEMAQRIYREWFVHFRFPGHENVPMVDADLGPIPEHWVIGRVLDFGKVITGKTPSTAHPEYFGDDMPFVKTPDMHGRIFCNEVAEHLSAAGADSQKNKTIPANSIIVNCIGALAGSVSITTTQAQTNQQINSIVLNNSVTREFMYFSLIDLRERLRSMGSNGATMINVNKSKFENLTVTTPPSDLLKEFHALVFPVFELVRNLQIKNQNLRATRDLLLPKLISGEIPVEAADDTAAELMEEIA